MIALPALQKVKLVLYPKYYLLFYKVDIVYLSNSIKICSLSNEPKHISLRFELNRSELTPIVPVQAFICCLHPDFPPSRLAARLQLSWQCRQNFTNDYRLLALPQTLPCIQPSAPHRTRADPQLCKLTPRANSRGRGRGGGRGRASIGSQWRT